MNLILNILNKSKTMYTHFNRTKHKITIWICLVVYLISLGMFYHVLLLESRGFSEDLYAWLSIATNTLTIIFISLSLGRIKFNQWNKLKILLLIILILLVIIVLFGTTIGVVRYFDCRVFFNEMCGLKSIFIAVVASPVLLLFFLVAPL